MNITQLREKYKNAHEAYLKYKDTNQTNNIEAAFIPEILKAMNRDLFVVPDCLLNYLGADLVDLKTGYTYDIKVCQHLHGTEVMIDAYKKNEIALDSKINNAFVFLNADNIIIVPFKYVYDKIPPREECFYLKRDLYHTTLKAVIDVKDCRKLVIPRSTK